MSKSTSKVGKIIGIIAASILGFVLVVLFLIRGVLLIGSHARYGEFYKLMTREVGNPGLWADYVPQGMTFNDDEGYYASCGYMKDGSQSRIYTVTKTGRSKKGKHAFYQLTSEGKPWSGHTGGLQYSNGNFYIASEQDGVFCFPASQLGSDGTAEIGPAIKVNNNSSFVFADEKFIYVGEFAHVPQYPCVHNFSNGEIEHTAIMSKYRYGDFEHPVAVFSIPDEVQGVGVTENGTMIVSRSWGIDFASYDVYKTDRIVPTEYTMDGAPVYFFAEPTHQIASTYFSEDIDIANGKLISMTEGAANKYYIGKFIFDYFIFSFNVEDLEKF